MPRWGDESAARMAWHRMAWPGMAWHNEGKYRITAEKKDPVRKGFGARTRSGRTYGTVLQHRPAEALPERPSQNLVGLCTSSADAKS